MKVEIDRDRFCNAVRQGLAFVLRLSLVLGGLGFASVFAVALLVGGIYLIATGHPTGGYALVGGACLWSCIALSLIVVAVVKTKGRINESESA